MGLPWNMGKVLFRAQFKHPPTRKFLLVNNIPNVQPCRMVLWEQEMNQQRKCDWPHSSLASWRELHPRQVSWRETLSGNCRQGSSGRVWGLGGKWGARDDGVDNLGAGGKQPLFFPTSSEEGKLIGEGKVDT